MASCLHSTNVICRSHTGASLLAVSVQTKIRSEMDKPDQAGLRSGLSATILHAATAAANESESKPGAGAAVTNHDAKTMAISTCLR